MSLAGVGRIRSAVTAALAAGLLITACGSTSTSSTSSPSPTPTPTPKANLITSVDACTLVAATDAGSVLGGTFMSATSVPGACFYSSTDGKTTVLVFAQVYPDSTTADAVKPDQIAAAINSGYGVTNATAVTVNGAKAVEYTLTGAATGYVIFVFKSNVIIMIAVTPSATDSPARQLATIAVGNLK